MNPENYIHIDGLRMRKIFSEDVVRSVYTYKPGHNDIFVATYPKCGTTWTQCIILSILSKGNQPRTLEDFLQGSQYLELVGAEAAEKTAGPGVFKTHLPAHKVPYSESAKYIYVARNPYDVCVSYYYHSKGFTTKDEKGASFERFVELFIDGKLSYGDYFDHLLSWYEYRDRTSVLFLTYEQMSKDRGFWALKIADFLGNEYASELQKDHRMLEKVLDATSFRNIKDFLSDMNSSMVVELQSLPPEKALKSVGGYHYTWFRMKRIHQRECFVRKGVVGDWKAHFTPKMITKFKEWIQRKTEGCDVMQLWSDIELP